VANAVQANLLAATSSNPAALNEVFNVAVNARHSLKELFEIIRTRLLSTHKELSDYQPRYRAFRPGDILHSFADISKAREQLGYEPTHTLEQGLDEALEWYVKHVGSPKEYSTSTRKSVEHSEEECVDHGLTFVPVM
jgi:UDP-N-acetylglucosamine 4-epimerase